MHIPHSTSLVKTESSIAPLLIGSSITWRRKVSSVHSRNLQQILGQVSPLGEWNASPPKKHPPSCMSSCANCLTTPWLTCHVLFAHSAPGRSCSPGLPFVGMGGDTIPTGPTHTSSSTRIRAATSLQVSALTGVSLGQDHSLPPCSMILCYAAEHDCCLTLQLMFY